MIAGALYPWPSRAFELPLVASLINGFAWSVALLYSPDAESAGGTSSSCCSDRSREDARGRSSGRGGGRVPELVL